MPTTKPRISITVLPEIQKTLVRLAQRDQIPTATKAARLFETAIELEEDQIWEVIAKQRDTKNARYRSHTVAWK